MQYKSKQTSYELAHEMAQKAKKILGLSQYDAETLEHDINNLRAHEWIDLFNMIPDSNEVKKLYFTHCVELENENEQELEEDMESKETSKQDTTSKLTIDFILFTDLVFDTYQDNGDNYQAAIDRAQDIFPNIEFRKDDPDFEHITLYGDRRQIEKFLNFYNYGDNWKSRIKKSYTDQELEESTKNPYFTPYGYKDAMKVLNGKAPTYYYHLKEIEMDSGDGAKLANYAKKLGLNVIQDPDSDPDYPTWYIPGEYHWDDYFYPYPYAHEYSIDDKKEQELEEDMEDKTYAVTVKYHNEPNAKIEARSAKDRKDLEYQLNLDDEVEWYDFDEKQFNEGYSKEGYSWDEINGMIHIYENGKLIDKYPDMESAEEAGWDLNELNESLDQMREKALKMKETSSAFAILYGYRTKDGKEVDLEPEEFATEEEYKERIQQITNSFTKLSDKDPRGNRYGKESRVEFYTIYPNKMPMNEDYGKKAFTSIVKKDGKIAWAYDADDKKYAIMAAQSYLKKLQGSDACVLDNAKGVSVWNSNEGEKENPKSSAFGISANANPETTSNGNATLNTEGAVEKIKFIATEIFNGLGKKYSVDIVDGYKVHITDESKDLTNSINNIKSIASNGLEAVAEKMPDGTYSYKFQKKGTVMMKESNDSLKWNMGSDKSRLSQEELDLLDGLAQKLEVNSPNGYKYVIQSTYEDYGSGMKWWNIICYNKKGHSWQVLNTKEWLDLMNTGDVDRVYQDVVNGDYFQDKQKEINEMNMGELFNHMED